MKIVKLLIICATCMYACKKQAGIGGRASIAGKIFAIDINSGGVIQDSGYVQDYDVFISYGDNNTIDDKARTNENGEFKFNNLQKGKYSIRVFGYCTTCTLNQDVKIVPVELTESKQSKNLSDIRIMKK